MAEKQEKRETLPMDVAVAERTKKAQASRAITQAKVEKLSDASRHALRKITACKASLTVLADHVTNGGMVSGDLLDTVSEVEGKVGRCLFPST